MCLHMCVVCILVTFLDKFTEQILRICRVTENYRILAYYATFYAGNALKTPGIQFKPKATSINSVLIRYQLVLIT